MCFTRVRGPRPLMAGVRQQRQNANDELAIPFHISNVGYYAHSAVLYEAVICQRAFNLLSRRLWQLPLCQLGEFASLTLV